MKIVLGLGTNLGDREDNLAQGLDRIEKLPKTQVLALSNVYETEPFDVPDEQGAYLNCCVLLETQLEPQALLDKCLTIEKALGRVRKSYHGARTLDIDLLIGEGVTCQTETLTLPHPHIRERAFVLVPLSDLFPLREGLGYSFHDAFEAVDEPGVYLYQ